MKLPKETRPLMHALVKTVTVTNLLRGWDTVVLAIKDTKATHISLMVAKVCAKILLNSSN